MKAYNKKQYIGDCVVALLLAAALICVSVLYGADKSGNAKVRISRDGTEIDVYDLSHTDSLYIDGVRIDIRDGRAYISDSDCPDKVCMNMHGVDKNGGAAVCIPNRIVLEPVKDTGSNVTDAIAG